MSENVKKSLTKPSLLVLLVEDDIDFAKTVGDYLLTENIECDYAFNGQAGLNAVTSNRYDLILLDLSLPKIDGLSVCEKLRAQDIMIPVLMLTARDTIDDKVAGFDAGADDYLLKPFAFEELIVRIRALVRRAQSMADNITIADLNISFSQRTATRNGRYLKLSPTGWVMLEMLARNSPKVVLKDQLERAIWGNTPPMNDNLRAHVFKLRQQLQQLDEAPVLHTISGTGFVLRENEK